MVEPAGTCHPDFSDVATAFRRNFDELDEVGASVCVTVDGERVVDLWGGRTAEDAEAPAWTADTLVVVFSCTKGMTATCAHVLASRGELDLDAAVVEYWPEFGKAGKEGATVRMMLDHSVGVPALRAKLPAGSVYDWSAMVGRLEEEVPFWEPGIRNGYHALTFGWTVGELVRRVSGRSLGSFLREEVSEPAGADIWLGLPYAQEKRVAPVIPFVPDPMEPTELTQAIRADRNSLPGLMVLNQGRFNPNSREAHAAELGGAGGLATARGLADLYRPLALGGGDLVDPETLDRMGEVAVATDRDAVLLAPTRFSLGFMKSMDNRRRHSGDRDSVILSSAAFGHVGAGGSIGFADPAGRMSFGYAMNRMGPGFLLNGRGQGLVDAVYRSLGYRSNGGGVWAR